jgi:hypothetical protein
MVQFHGTDAETVERRLAETAEDDRRRVRLYWQSALLLVAWPAIGVGVMAWGFQMDDPSTGQAIFFAGAALADAGILGTLVWAYRRFGE